MKRKLFTKPLFLTLGIFAGFMTLGLGIKWMNPELSADSFFIEGIILSSLPFWLTSDQKYRCTNLQPKG